MSNYTGPERRRDATTGTPPAVDYAPPGDRTKDQFKAILRWALTLSSLAMLAFAALTYFQVLAFPQWTALIFVAVAAMDLVIGLVVFGPSKR